MTALQEAIDMQELAEVADGDGGRIPKEIEAYAEQDSIEYTRDQDPFPDLMFGDEMMGLDIRLECYDYFFEHNFEQIKRTYLWRNCPIMVKR
jgi:hypothetical protein